ncbi:MAG: gamma-glutamylcyclotransferase [Dehalococcoidia bacterium]|nr:gamma-glutamylcyclotransferase [Dehalococcoidia bacterium]
MMRCPGAHPTPSGPAGNPAPHLRIFAYGSLMQGGEFHDEFCTGALSIEKASVRGLVDRSGRYPVLTVPESDILAVGTADVWKDLDAQERHGAFIEGADLLSEPWAAAHLADEGGPQVAWEWVEGELITLEESVSRLPTLDHLEGFIPDGKNLYRRVLAPARNRETAEVEVAWARVR